jgi:hypothetical protein
MRPTVSEQLAGISAILTDLIATHLYDDYARDMLLEAASALTTLSQTWYAVPDFLRWDSEITAGVLRLIGSPVPPPPDDRFDIRALEAHHRQIRDRLEECMPIILANPAATEATVEVFRERAKRFDLLAHSSN